MPLPSAVTTVVLDGPFLDGQGVGDEGEILFTPFVAGGRLSVPGSAERITVRTMRARVVAGRLEAPGGGPFRLIATDDPDIVPSGNWRYLVEERLRSGQSRQPYYITVPVATVGVYTNWVEGRASITPVDTSAFVARPEFTALSKAVAGIGVGAGNGAGGVGGVGPKGADGAPGLRGLQGLAGADGAPGLRGLQGLAGADGARGLQGLAGAPGVKGDQGIPGAKGADGAGGALADGGITAPKLADKSVVRRAIGDAAIDLPQLSAAINTTLTNSASQGNVTDAIAGIVGGAPANLNTLAELAGALGDDGDLAGTLNGLLALKYAKPTGGIPTTDLSAPVRDLLVTAAANAQRLAAVEASINQILNPPAAAPTALVLTATAGDGKITITRAGGESSTQGGQPTSTTYALYRGTTATGTAIATTFPFVDLARPNGTAVSYIATAKNTQGQVTSAVVTATPSGTPLPTPTAFFKAANITGVAEGGKVSAVPTGGGGPGWEQTDVAAQPTYRADYNGRPAVFFAGGWLRTVGSINYDSKAFVVARVWFPATPNSTNDQGIMACDDGAAGGGKRLWQFKGIKPGLLRSFAFNGTNPRTDTVTGLTGGAWHLVAGRWGSNGTESWINGVSDGATSGSVASTGLLRPIMLGGSNVATDGTANEKMTGLINEARIYYRDVSDDEVRAIFADMGVVA